MSERSIACLPTRKQRAHGRSAPGAHDRAAWKIAISPTPSGALQPSIRASATFSTIGGDTAFRLERGLDGAKQGSIAAWLFQEIAGARLHRMNGRPNVPLAVTIMTDRSLLILLSWAWISRPFMPGSRT